VSAAAPYAVAARALLRDTLLDAAREALRDRDWEDVTMAEIALAAGVSRQTLYKQFGSRDEFAQAFVLRESDRFLVAVEEALRANVDDPPAALQAAVDVFLTAVRDDPLVRDAILNPADGGGMLATVTTQGEPVIERSAGQIARVVLESWPQVGRESAELLAETLVRLAISYAILPKGPAEMTAASVRTLLEPYLERALAAKSII
jgi:AcrR family transcriptional regulator